MDASCFVHAKVRDHGDGYEHFEQLVAEQIKSIDGPVFETDASPDELWRNYLMSLPHDRQHYNCNCCKKFIQTYGRLVTINEDGHFEPLLWNKVVVHAAPRYFANAVQNMRAVVRNSKIAGVFLSGDKTWGTPQTTRSGVPSWTHLSGDIPAKSIFSHPLKSASQAMAEKLEDYKMLQRGLAEYPKSVVEQAVRVLEADAVDRSEKTLGVAKWLLSLHQAVERLPKTRKDNYIWRAVATAPAGFCHVRSTMIDTLLDDLAAGLSFDVVQKRWNAKMHPLQYQRPTTVKAGNVEAAERIVGQLESAGALKRRFAKLCDVKALWMPMADMVEGHLGSSVFGHIRPTRRPVAPSNVNLPTQRMTWEKFARTVLTDAENIEVVLPYGRGAFYGLVTAQDYTAAPLLQWDTNPRNPVSWYFYHGGSSASDWNLRAGSNAKVTAIFEKPAHWYEPEKFRHHGRSIFLALDGAKDLRHTAGGALFPECLRNEYHEVRSTIEAYSRSAKIEGRDEGNANGISIDGSTGVTLRVTGRLGTATYIIDRLD